MLSSWNVKIVYLLLLIIVMTTVNFNEKLKHKENLKYSNIKSWGKQLREQNKEQNKSNGVAQCRTEAFKLFR